MCTVLWVAWPNVQGLCLKACCNLSMVLLELAVKKCQRAHRPLNRPSYQDGLRFRIEAKSGLLTRSRIEDDVNY